MKVFSIILLLQACLALNAQQLFTWEVCQENWPFELCVSDSTSDSLFWSTGDSGLCVSILQPDTLVLFKYQDSSSLVDTFIILEKSPPIAAMHWTSIGLIYTFTSVLSANTDTVIWISEYTQDTVYDSVFNLFFQWGLPEKCPWDITLMVQNECGSDVSNTSIIHPFCYSAIDKVEISNVDVYPNPTKGIVKLDSDRIIESISLFDLYGSLVLEQHPYQSFIDLSAFSNGLYLLSIKTDHGTEVHPILKQ